MEFYHNEIRCLKNYQQFEKDRPLLLCLHGNSSSAETFIKLIDHPQRDIQILAIDLPGCGKSKRLDRYTMQSVADEVQAMIDFIGPKRLFLFGHSLGGHLIGFITARYEGIVISGTPPLGSSKDLGEAFTPNEGSTKLIPLLSQELPFSYPQATDFISHTGVQQPLLDLMIEYAVKTDGRFRSGCLSTLTSINQLEQLENYNNLIVFHAEFDGVINKQYLIDHFKDSLYILDGKHMLPLSHSQEILTIIKQKFSI